MYRLLCMRLRILRIMVAGREQGSSISSWMDVTCHVHKPAGITYAADSLNSQRLKRHRIMRLSEPIDRRPAPRQGVGSWSGVATRRCAVALLPILLTCATGPSSIRATCGEANRTLL